MTSCDAIRPLLSHVAEGEVAPDEAMRVARHLADCTACKIVLARERRLARMLEQDLLDLPVGEEFVQSVMATLPQGPPPRARKSQRRRGLRLAGLAGFLGAGALALSQIVPSGAGGAGRVGLPAMDFEAANQSLQGLAGLARLAVMALEAVARLPLETLPLGWAPELLAAAVATSLVAMGMGSVLVALAAGTLVRVTR
jgi:anti-sigma factor RsiW